MSAARRSRTLLDALSVPLAVLGIFLVLLGAWKMIARFRQPAFVPAAPSENALRTRPVIIIESKPLAKFEPDMPTKVESERMIPPVPPGQLLARSGDEIVVCGQFFHTGTPVVLWMDPGGYDAYRTESRFAPFAESDWEKASKIQKELKSPNRYGLRASVLSSDEIERVRGGGWDLPLLQRVVDQFVLHYDVVGTSRTCFKVLHDMRCLSVHFMLDIDGTIYQTLDLKERAWHATTSNTRSIGIEIANIGAYPDNQIAALENWYKKDDAGNINLILPDASTAALHTPNFKGRPMRKEIVSGEIQGKHLNQYDYTPQQYEALIKLTAALCKVFPNLKCDYPREPGSGELITHKLPDDELKNYHGILGHYHIQTEKIDPGPALQWDRVIEGAKRAMEGK